jgi:hypothetical protein
MAFLVVRAVVAQVMEMAQVVLEHQDRVITDNLVDLGMAEVEAEQEPLEDRQMQKVDLD